MATRLSPGVWRTADGKTVRSATDPDKGKPKAKPDGKGGQSPGKKAGFFVKPGDINSASDAINTQTDANIWAADQNDVRNRANESNTFGSRQYTTDPVTGRVTITDALSGGQQRINDAQEGYDAQALGGAQRSLGQAQNNFNSPYSYAGLPQVPGQNDLLGERRRVEDSLLNRWDERMNPQFEQERSGALQSLADRGIAPGSPLYQKELERLDRQQNDARQSARAGATEMGGSEYSRNFDMGMQNRQQAIGEYDTQRRAPMEEAAMQFQGVRGVVNPSFNPMAGIQMGAPDVTGTYAAYKGLDLQQQGINKQGGGGGGGGGGSTRSSVDSYLFNRMGQGSPTQGVGSSGSSSSGWGGVAGNIGQGFGAGAVAGSMRPQSTQMRPLSNQKRGFFSAP